MDQLYLLFSNFISISISIFLKQLKFPLESKVPLISPISSHDSQKAYKIKILI